MATLGLALFVYTMGLACGPGALASLRRHGFRLAVLVGGSLLVGLIAAKPMPGRLLKVLQPAHYAKPLSGRLQPGRPVQVLITPAHRQHAAVHQ